MIVFFTSFAFGKSYEKVYNESKIYMTFKNPKNFEVSKIYGLVNNKSLYCSFKLSNNISNKKSNRLRIIILFMKCLNFLKQAIQKK